MVILLLSVAAVPVLFYFKIGNYSGASVGEPLVFDAIQLTHLQNSKKEYKCAILQLILVLVKLMIRGISGKNLPV